MSKKKITHYTQGSLWKTRKSTFCWSDEICYIPENKIVMFLEERCIGFHEDIKVLYEGHICYLEGVDVAHTFNLNPYEDKE